MSIIISLHIERTVLDQNDPRLPVLFNDREDYVLLPYYASTSLGSSVI